MDFFGKTIDGSRSLYLDELTVTWNADILATSLFSKPAVFDTTLKITETLTLGDTNSVTLSPNFITSPYTLFLPPTQGAASTFLENNGSGVLTWRSSTTLPYVTSVALTAPAFLTVTGSPITTSGTLSLTYSGTPLPVLNGGTGVTTSTGTGNNVLSNNAYLTGADLTDTFLDGTITLASPLSILNGGTGVTTSTGSGSNVLSNNADLIGADLTDTFLDGTLTLDTPLSTENGGTGLSSIGTNGQFLASNGTNLYWESSNQIGIMRYKQKYYPYIYLTPPAGMQLWFGGSAFLTSNIDFRTLYPVEGAQLGLSLTYGYEENFGRFVNGYSFPVIAEISYSAARFQPGIPVIETGAGVQYDAPLAIFTSFLNGGTSFYIEKNNNGDALATSSSNSGVFCTASVTIVLQPNDFFQLRGSTTSTITGLINVESEIFIQLQGVNSPPVMAPAAPGSGTVTSVNISSSDPFFAVGGGPITTSGTLSIGLSGTALPTLSGGTGLVNVGTTGQVLTSNGTDLSWQTPSPPGTGTVTSVSATAPSFLSVSGSPITTSGTLALTYSGTALPTLNGGTGLTAVGTNGQVLTSNGTDLSWQTPLPPGTGTVTSVSATVPAFLSVTGSPITTSGTLAIDYSGTALPTLNGGTGLTAVGTNGQVLTSDGTTLSWQTPLPPGTGTVTSVSATVPAFLNVTGSPITASGTLAIGLSGTALPTANGGTGLDIVGTSGQVLTSNGSTLSWQTPAPPGTGTVTSVSASVPSFLTVTGSPITSSGTLSINYSGAALPIANGGTGSTTATGTGAVVLQDAATMGALTVTSGLQILGFGGATGWTSILSNIGTGNNSGIRGDGAQNGFNFGWNVSGGGAESIITYGTLGIGRLDICSWDGTTRTTTLSINSSGGVTFGSNLYPNIRGTNGQVLTTNGSGTLSWQTPSSPGTGTVTSVSASVPSFLTVSGSPITTSGTLGLTYSGVPLPILNGGTGLTSVGLNGQVLATNGVSMVWQTRANGSVLSVAASVPSFLTVSGSPITTSGTLAISYSGTALPVANGGTGVTTSTGTLNNVLSNNPTLNDTILNGITTATRGLNVLGGTGSTGWTSILSGIGTGNNTGIRGDGTQNGFNFGWNVSGGQAESIITYGTLGFGRLDICSWDGTTRTTTLSINSSGVVSIPLGATISSGLTVNGDSLYTSSLTINGITRTPQINGSGTSGDLTITSTRNLATNVSSNYTLNAANINLNSANPVFSNNRRIDNVYGYMEFFLTAQDVFNNNETNLIMTQTTASGFPLTLTAADTWIQNTYGQVILVTATFAVTRRGANNTGSSQSWIQIGTLSNSRRLGFGTPLGYSAFGSSPFPIGLGIRYGTAMFALDVNEYFVLRVYQDSGATQPFNGINYNTSGEVPTYLYISYAGI